MAIKQYMQIDAEWNEPWKLLLTTREPSKSTLY